MSGGAILFPKGRFFGSGLRANRLLTRAAQYRLPSRDRKEAVMVTTH
jgi:hypothetical protein